MSLMRSQLLDDDGRGAAAAVADGRDTDLALLQLMREDAGDACTRHAAGTV